MSDDASVWPLLRQLWGRDKLAFGPAAQSERTREWTARTEDAKVVKSVCPYCAVGCGQKLFVKNGELIQIEGDPDSPISRGRLCPKGSATRSLVQSPLREYKVKYRRPYGTQWEELPLERAMEMIARTSSAHAARDVGSQRRRRQDDQSLLRDRKLGRRNARQRRELSHEEALHCAWRRAGRESSSNMT